MKLETISEKDNPLLKRKEVEVRILQEASTPSRESLKKQVSKDMKVPEERIAIHQIRQPFGRKESVAQVRLYASREDLERIEQKYAVERGKSKPKEGEAPKAEAEGPKGPGEAEGSKAKAPKVPGGVQGSEAPREEKKEEGGVQ